MKIILEKHLINSLPLETDWIMPLLEKDKKIMYNYGIASLAIRTGKYKNDVIKQRRKLKAVKNEFIDCFIYSYLKKKRIVVNLIVKLVKDYWKEFNSYDNIMKQIDKLLWNPPVVPFVPDCDCRNIGFGFCFCRK